LREIARRQGGVRGWTRLVTGKKGLIIAERRSLKKVASTEQVEDSGCEAGHRSWSGNGTLTVVRWPNQTLADDVISHEFIVIAWNLHFLLSG